MAEVLSVTDMIPNTFEPKRKDQWIFLIEGIDAFLMKTAARPTMEHGEIEIDWINTKRYLMGKPAYAQINVTLHDPIAPSGAQQVMEWMRLHYESVSGRAGYADFYKRDVALKKLDPIGSVCELWEGKGVFIVTSNFGDLDYTSADPDQIELTLRADNWILQY